MPGLRWLPEALRDLRRLHAHLAEVSPDAARKAMARIAEGADHLQEHPEPGRRLDDERREWLVRFGASAYVLRCRVDPDGHPVVLRVRHGREERCA